MYDNLLQYVSCCFLTTQPDLFISFMKTNKSNRVVRKQTGDDGLTLYIDSPNHTDSQYRYHYRIALSTV